MTHKNFPAGTKVLDLSGCEGTVVEGGNTFLVSVLFDGIAQRTLNPGQLTIVGRGTKPYFAKYLPVEGEIREGDKFYHKGILGTCLNGEKWKGEKKVKLFLCSRDIQVGDKFMTTDNHKEAECINTFINNIQGIEGMDEFLANPNDCFKVIGEIAPDALSYVKEGDEFNENDVSHYLAPTSYYKIKGPCGHFH